MPTVTLTCIPRWPTIARPAPKRAPRPWRRCRRASSRSVPSAPRKTPPARCAGCAQSSTPERAQASMPPSRWSARPRKAGPRRHRQPRHPPRCNPHHAPVAHRACRADQGRGREHGRRRPAARDADLEAHCSSRGRRRGPVIVEALVALGRMRAVNEAASAWETA